MRLALAQMSAEQDATLNLQKSLRFISQTKGADMLIFPENQLAPHTSETSTGTDFCLDEEDWRINEFCHYARVHYIYILISTLSLHNGQAAITDFLISNQGEIIGHLIRTSAVSSHTFQLPFGRVGVVNADYNQIPEAIETCILQNAQVVLIPTAISHPSKIEDLKKQIQLLAVHNHLFIVCCNHASNGRESPALGHSFIACPEGNLLSEAGVAERLIFQEILLSGNVKGDETKRVNLL